MRRHMPSVGSIVLRIALYITIVLLLCEWAVYWVVLCQCNWPEVDSNGESSRPLKAIMLADTHLLGSKHGHWFDKLRREWQMRRTFQTAVSLFQPDVVFILGDLFDEGEICDDEEWDIYVNRFHSMFSVPKDTLFHVVVGNHDIGFHYKVKSRPQLFERFVKTFELPSVQLLEIKGNVFVLVNSIAFEGDSCTMCKEAETQLQKIADKLNCEGAKHDSGTDECRPYSTSPILLQHFPLFRSTEANCTDGLDAPPEEIRNKKNRQHVDVLSQEASSKLLSLLKPRLVIDGHTHFSCSVTHNDNILEVTVPSFSWRNNKGPSFLMAVFTPEQYGLSKCYMPHENSVIWFYSISGIVLVVINLHYALSVLLNRRRVRRFVNLSRIMRD